ncbi:hypothetical protein HAX54_024089 [Datura stramonium]|uniref:Uncharacterized protein n=1 Tax=Datura stramonium TaxID=4076 RepID=A0ABS8UYV2_DATST|nr:hypothetical protein [Datura stramonium]
MSGRVAAQITTITVVTSLLPLLIVLAEFRGSVRSTIGGRLTFVLLASRSVLASTRPWCIYAAFPLTGAIGASVVASGCLSVRPGAPPPAQDIVFNFIRDLQGYGLETEKLLSRTSIRRFKTAIPALRMRFSRRLGGAGTFRFLLVKSFTYPGVVEDLPRLLSSICSFGLPLGLIPWLSP